MPLTDILADGDELQIRVRVTDSLGNVQYFPAESGSTTIAGGFVSVETVSGMSFAKVADLHVGAVSAMSFNRVTDAHVGTVSAMAFFRQV